MILSPDPYGSNPFDTEYRANTDCPEICEGYGLPVRTALNRLWRDEKHASDMKEILVAVTSFCIFVAAMFLHIPTTSMYYQSSAMSPASSRSALDVGPPLKFLQIESVPDIFNWLSDSFIPQVFVTEDYNGHTLPAEEWGQIGGLNKVLGAVSFQVIRMEPDECNVPDFLEKLYPSCYDESSTDTEELLITFDTNSTDARAILAKKKANGGWLDLATQQLQITILTINGELPGYAVTKLQLDFNPGGYIEPSSWTTSTLLDQFPNSVTLVLDILVLLWFFPWMLFSALTSVIIRYKNMSRESSSRHINELLRHAGLAVSFCFPDGWLAVDALRGPIVYAYYITVFITQSAMTNVTFRSKLSSLRNTGTSENAVKTILSSVTNSFEHIANLTVLLRLLATAAVFVLGLRVLNTFRDHVGLSILTRTIASAVRSFRTFSVIFAVIFVAFASAGAVLFGSSVEEFSSLQNSTKTCVNMLFNNFDVKTIAQIDYSVAYYWSYMSLMTFVLLNIVLAIVVDAYKEEKDKKDKSKCWVFNRVLNHVLRHSFAPIVHVLAICFCRSPGRRYAVVFWGRIRSHVLHDALTDRLGTMPLDWTPQTKLTPRVLKNLFPEATIHECENTIRHLTTKYINQVCCPTSEETEPTNRASQRSTLTSSTVKSPEELKQHCYTAEGENSDVAARLDLLEQKLDFLIEKLAHKTL
ncbi:Polycystin-2 [Phytophthora citrophthora]|uniref:Polycystin-2 n=1 Tax=Phytophthora citrophthora TaxID=4793 RepID=A0AAD9H150_9STRA|nr:Polycystin-2 [Phytophthora citrophthora]